MLFRCFLKTPFCLSILLLILFNIFLISSSDLSLFDQSLNILLSTCIFEYFRNKKLDIKKRVSLFEITLSLFILFFTLYRSFLVYSIDDKFIYFVFPLLLISLIIFNFSLKNLFLCYKAVFLTFLLPIKELLFIPLSILLTPLSTVITWFVLNLLGFDAYTKGQEIFIGSGGVDITFSCSGSEQIIFSISSMFALSLLIPFKKVSIFYFQLIISFFITYFVNIFRLCILAVFVDSYQSNNFSIFDFFHGSNGSLLFALISTVLCCEIYKRLYSSNKLNFLI